RKRMQRHNGGDPFLGRRHRQLLLEAGFARSEATASLWRAGSLKETRELASYMKAQRRSVVRTALPGGWEEQATLDAGEVEIGGWGEGAEAFLAVLWCEAMGW